MTQQPPIDFHGAVDLSASANAGSGEGPAVEGPYVTELSEATFNDAVQLSTSVPVVVELWSPRAEASTTLGATLSGLAREYAGRFQHARVEAEKNTQILGAFGVQGVPAVVAIVGGQALPLFQGSASADEIRPVIEQVLATAAQLGVTGVLTGAGEDAPEEDEPAEEPLPPLHAEAQEALERQDFDAAAEAYRKALAEDPADSEAAAALAQVELIQRVSDLDAAAALAAAGSAPFTDVEVHVAAADVEFATGNVDAAFDRLLSVVRATFDDDRDAARLRLLDYFGILGGEDDRVLAARRKLTSALY